MGKGNWHTRVNMVLYSNNNKIWESDEEYLECSYFWICHSSQTEEEFEKVTNMLTADIARVLGFLSFLDMS